MIDYQVYKLKLSAGKISGIQIFPHQKDLKTFIRPATKSKLPKIYIIRHNTKIVYVGITTQSISNRLRYGLGAEGRNGYHGYKWKNLNEIDLFVFFFNDSIEKIETVEAEIVYLIRSKTGVWPEYQTEIHFHNATQKEKAAARQIFNEATRDES